MMGGNEILLIKFNNHLNINFVWKEEEKEEKMLLKRRFFFSLQIIIKFWSPTYAPPTLDPPSTLRPPSFSLTFSVPPLWPRVCPPTEEPSGGQSSAELRNVLQTPFSFGFVVFFVGLCLWRNENKTKMMIEISPYYLSFFFSPLFLSFHTTISVVCVCQCVCVCVCVCARAAPVAKGKLIHENVGLMNLLLQLRRI